MLDQLMLSKMVAAYETTVDTLGVPVTVNIDTWGSPIKCQAGLKTVGVEDDQLANSYGVGSRIITIKKKSVPIMPAKYDTVDINDGGESLVISNVTPVQINNVIVGYRLATSGK